MMPESDAKQQCRIYVDRLRNDSIPVVEELQRVRDENDTLRRINTELDDLNKQLKIDKQLALTDVQAKAAEIEQLKQKIKGKNAKLKVYEDKHGQWTGQKDDIKQEYKYSKSAPLPHEIFSPPIRLEQLEAATNPATPPTPVFNPTPSLFGEHVIKRDLDLRSQERKPRINPGTEPVQWKIVKDIDSIPPPSYPMLHSDDE